MTSDVKRDTSQLPVQMRKLAMRNPVIHSPMTTVVQPSGSLTAKNASEFQEQLMNVISSQHCKALLVDLGAVDTLDSAGLLALVSALSLAQRLNKQFSLCEVSPSIRIIFELTQLDRVFDILGDRPSMELAA